jgi:hypothetical protein
MRLPRDLFPAGAKNSGKMPRAQRRYVFSSSVHPRARGHRHHAAVRSLAFKWIRILFRCWKSRQSYDEARYLKQLHAKGVPYLNSLQPT